MPDFCRYQACLISIHAPRVGSDFSRIFTVAALRLFQSTLPVWGATFSALSDTTQARQFQSTLPVWGATAHACAMFRVALYFNPRSPCGERLRGLPLFRANTDISIHAPRVGSDPNMGLCARLRLISIHAPRVGSDRRGVEMFLADAPISIHAPRVGSDNARHRCRCLLGNFNPRSPCGERRICGTSDMTAH